MAAVSPEASTRATLPRDRGDFEIAVICALKLEAECVYDVLDSVWDDKKFDKDPRDDNAYTLGVIGEHNVVLIHMPSMSSVSAAYAVGNLKMSFSSIRLALVVGVCGGMPYRDGKQETLLGDVVISTALIQYTLGKQYPGGFKRKTDMLDTLGPPSPRILGVLQKLRIRQHMQVLQDNTTTTLQAIQEKSSMTKHPGKENDILYHSSYAHQHHPSLLGDECETDHDICDAALKLECEDLGCASAMRVARKRLADPSTTQPMIHFGIIGSGDTVMKSGLHRDTLAEKEGIIALEMEGAGVWRYFPSIVIKGVCDYADSHKRKGWQQYAAATAAACTKAFLMEWRPERRDNVYREPSSLHTSSRIGHISDRNGPELYHEELVEIADILLSFDTVALELCEAIFKLILTGKFNKDDPNAKVQAISDLQDIVTAAEELSLIRGGRQQFHQDFLKNAFLIEYTRKTLSLLSQFVKDPTMVESICQAFRNMLRIVQGLPAAVRKAASLDLLERDARAGIRRRWIGIREMCEFMVRRSLLNPHEMVPSWPEIADSIDQVSKIHLHRATDLDVQLPQITNDPIQQKGRNCPEHDQPRPAASRESYTFPTVVMKAGCDYADSHKKKQWQEWAAMTVASGAKAFIGQLQVGISPNVEYLSENISG